MGIFKNLVKATIDTVLVPVEVLKDCITLGNPGEPETYTGARVRKIGASLEKAYNELDD
jgi:hypothetical protein